MNRIVKRFCLGALPLMLAVFLTGCQQRNEFVAPPPPQVQVAQPIEQAIVDTIDFSGTTTAFARVEIRARVQGYLHEINFQDGADVKKGDVLFVIEQAPFQAALKSSEAEKQKALANLQLAQANLRRSEQLAQDRAVSESQLDLHRAEVATAQATVSAAEAAVETAELDLSYTVIRAPISGRIGRHLLDEGNLVHGEQTLLAVIETLDPIYATFYLSESDLLRFMNMLQRHELPDPSEQAPALYMGLEGDQGYPFEGTLDFRELGIDPDTGTTLRRGLFKNPGKRLLPGLFVRIRAPIGQPRPKLLVEERALGTDQQGTFLLVVDGENKVDKRLVELGIAVGNMRVIEDGISASDRVVINGLLRARPGAEVDPQPREMVAQIPPAHRGVFQTEESPGQAGTVTARPESDGVPAAESARANPSVSSGTAPEDAASEVVVDRLQNQRSGDSGASPQTQTTQGR